MKSFFTILAVGLTLVTAAQNQPKGNARITGIVIDSLTSKPVEFANVALVNPATGVPLDGTVCDEKGEFSITKVALGEYRVVVTFIGFQNRTFPISIEERKDEIDLGRIILNPTPQVLKEVIVEGEKALIEERVDRTIYNAENDVTSRGGDASDVLKRVPLLSVDLDGNVSLRGNQNIRVLINNKPSTIVSSSIADALKQIPADEIKSVEVITSPSAKYDAEGSAGIINIITKKNTLQGLTLNVDTGIGLRGSNLGLNGNYRTGKMGFSLGGFGRSNYNVKGSFRNEQIIKNIDPVSGASTGADVYNLQQADTENQGVFGRYNFGWDYDIDKKNSLAASVRFGIRNNENEQFDLQRYTDGTLFTLQDIYSNDQSNNVDVSLTYTRLYDKPQRELSFQGLYSLNNGDNVFENFDKDLSNESVTGRFKNLNESFNREITLQADYQTPIGTTQMVEFGGKSILRQVVSDFTSYYGAGSDGAYVPSSSSNLSNNLNYDQNIAAGYLSYTINTRIGYSLKAGSRYEYTTIRAYTNTEENINIPSYGVMVPSVNVSKKLKGGNMVKASYNRRIQRPSIRFLNPNIQQSNPLNITIGNPELNPEYTNNYELSYSTFIKGTMINISGFARNTSDAIQSVRDVIGNDKSDADTIRTRYQNIGSENAYGASIFANVTIGKLSLNGGGDFYYAVLSNNNDYWLYRSANEGWVASGRVFGSYNLSKGWGLQFFSFYRGNQVQLQGSQGGFYMYSLGFRKEFNEKRGSVGLAAENFMQSSQKIRTQLETPLLSQNSLNVRYNFSFRVTFSYRIGKMTMQDRPRRPRRSINNDDLKDDGGGDGGMQMSGDGGQRTNGTFGGGQRNPAPRTSKPEVSTSDSQDKTIADEKIHEPMGTWTYTLDSPQGGGGVLRIVKLEGVYSGTIKSDRMSKETSLENLVVNNNQISFSYPVSFNGNTVMIGVKAKLTENSFEGTMNMGEYRSFGISGKRSQ